jgi:hypothetical protein
MARKTGLLLQLRYQAAIKTVLFDESQHMPDLPTRFELEIVHADTYPVRTDQHHVAVRGRACVYLEIGLVVVCARHGLVKSW